MIETRNLAQYAELHAVNCYGSSGVIKQRLLAPWVLLRRPKSILDYGAGQNHMVERFIAPGAAIRHRFEPAIPELSAIPLSRYELITNTDVLEHLDEDEIGAVLEDIARRCMHALFLVDTCEAKTILPNGENAHATVQPAEWWLSRIRQSFPDSELISAPDGKAFIRSWKAGFLSKAIAPLLGRILRLISVEK